MRKLPSFESQLSQLSLLASIPFLLLTLIVMLYASISTYLILLTAFLGGLVVAFANVRIHQKASYQFRSLTNLLEAMTNGDYSLRARSKDNSGALNELIDSINGLATRLQQQKQVSVESQLLLKTVIEHIDVAVIAIAENFGSERSNSERLNSDEASAQESIIFTNPAAKKMLKLDEGKKQINNIVSSIVDNVKTLQQGENKILNLDSDNLKGKFNVHLETFRQSGESNKLIFITDVRAILRQEERNAWQNLVRVISHEINNSLAPIASISQTLQKLTKQKSRSEEDDTDIIDGLLIIEQRAKGLTQFIDSYRKLAKLPEPVLTKMPIDELLNKLSILFEKDKIALPSHKGILITVDPIQIEQVLINLIKNALESQSQANYQGSVSIECAESVEKTVIVIKDRGVGIRNTENLFVPFYTTKKQGTGIGLIFCRQIIEAHKGELYLRNRSDGAGCEAIIELPMT